MKQYNAIKGKYPDALLLFRVGDFYETFGADAITASKILGITLTKRNNGAAGKTELAGFPHHALDTYLPKLVRAGQRVAICDQLEDPKKTKTIVKRGVTELVTPGVSLNDEVLEQKTNNFLACIHFEKDKAGIAFIDISTGEFLLAEGSFNYINKLIQGFSPSEIVFQKKHKELFQNHFGNSHYIYFLDEWMFTSEYANETLLKHFQTKSLKGFGVEGMDLGIIAAGVVLHYLSDTQHDQLKHVSKLSRIEEDRYVWLDKFTVRNLELLYSPNENAKTLLDVIDFTLSPMGGRLLKRWLTLPLKSKEEITKRLNIVEELCSDENLRQNIEEELNSIGDLERLISKVAVQRANPKEVYHLKNSLEILSNIKLIGEKSSKRELKKLTSQIDDCNSPKQLIEKTIFNEAPAVIGKGKVINKGVDKELDELRNLASSGKDYLTNLQKRLTEETGISSLKIAFNNVFGYYIEVRNTHKEKVPEDWIRKQTLANAERYITEELKEYETKILGAEEKILAIENKVFNELVLELSNYLLPIQRNAFIVAQLDCFQSFANCAIENNYTKPEFVTENKIEITEGRHPVIEKTLPIGQEYISNNIYLDDTTQQIIMITGPNMAGKSALLRQTALIVILAQMGSFVPAKKAHLGITDKIFTRVGASDNLSMGESTFMVEMNETASILNNLSNNSLVLLDEIGRGTSTYDGISIAWSIAEYMHQHPKFKAKTLFATHYHELNEMAKSFERIKNYNVSVKEIDGKILFLRKLVPGGSEHSFGIQVAKMAGIPKSVVNKANEVLKKLESSHVDEKTKAVVNEITNDNFQLSFFQLDDPVLEQIKEDILAIDINTLTPVEALMKLNEIKKLVGGK